jgi:hypothetical protein
MSAPGAGWFPAFPAQWFSLYSHSGPLASRIACEPYQTAGSQLASTSFLRRRLLPRRGRTLLPLLRRRRRWSLLLPGAELLLLLPLLLLVSLLHRGNRLSQRMRPLRSRLLRALLRHT